jgi:hypothetical protein
MKLFIYKILIVFFAIFVLYKITIGQTIRFVKSNMENFSSKENLENIKGKVRNEMKNAIQKERYLDQEDAELINNFFNKIKKELEKQ